MSISKPAAPSSAFTLLELTLVILLLSIVTGIYLKIASERTDATAYRTVNAQMDELEEAIYAFRVANNRLPCPADPTLGPGSSSYGLEAATPGTCAGSNLHLYPTAGTTHKGGMIPTRALGLPDSAAIDSWGKKIFYAVELSATASNAFYTYVIDSPTFGTITIYDESGVGTPRSTRALYVLLSAGRNGHGAYFSGAGAIGTRYSAGSATAEELQNCACDVSAAALSPNLNIQFYQKLVVTTSGLANVYDDVIRFKTRAQLGSYAESQ